MDSRRVERVEDWDSRPFAGGFDELRSLADGDFTGAVTAGTTWLFMLNGRVIGVFDGTIDDFDGGSGTTYEAPHPSVPLLFAMQETGGEERANYYTNDTPISEADSTLTSGKFTGFIELSENVLSGDYYVVYYGGRSMSCAFIGNQERLLTGDEAFERADDEVGIYTVMDVDIEVTDIPSPEPASGAADVADDGVDTAAGAAGAGAAATDAVDDAPADGTAVDGTAEPDHGPAAGGEEPTQAGERPGDDRRTGDTERTADQEPGNARAGGRADETRRPDETAPDESPAVPDAEADDSAQAPSTAEPTPDQADDGSPSRPSRETASGRSTEDRSTAGSTPTNGGTTQADDASPSTTEAPAGDASATAADDATADPVEIPDEVLEAVEREAAESEDPVFEEEAEWRETRSIPSINPDRSATETDDSTGSRKSRGQRRPSQQPAANSQQRGTSRSNGGSNSATSTGQSTGQPAAPKRSASQSEDAGEEPLEREMLQREDKIDRLQQRLSNVEEERTELREERDQLAEENDELRDEIDELEAEMRELNSELTDLEAELAAQQGPAADASTQLSPQQALEGTNLFVRYGSKGEATLDAAHDGDADADAVDGNLRIEHHTQFEADDAAVDGRPYVDFLHDSIEFRFVEWFVRELLYEIRDTGNASAMRDLYDAIPEADRAELHGSVSLRYDEDGNEQREQTTFDVVVRDRMGNPLVVANLNDSRDPTTEEMMVDIQERASRVKRTSESLSGAFVVTASFFDPGALETASEATSGSFLSRDSKKSFVKLSRKSGYHLCLVESRGGEFHINVPEL